MGKVTKPFWLTVARIDGRLDVAGIPMEGCDDHAHALRRELERDDSAIAYASDSTDHRVDQYEVYVIGRGNEKSPEIFTPDMVERWRSGDSSLLAP